MIDHSQQQQLHTYVSGIVQGVGFRYFVLRSALENNLVGWVRNKYDGRVEILAEGELNDLNRFLVALRQGPRSSQVTNVDYSFAKAQGKFDRFSVLSTG